MKIGIDLGGTKTEIAAFDNSGGACLRRRAPTPVGDYAATLSLIATLVADAERALGTRATIGIGTPGALSQATGLMRNSNSTCLNQRSFKADLQRTLGREARLANDANCFALSEARDGAAAGAVSVFGVIIGTGVGGGIVIHGQVVNGPNAITGEWGIIRCRGPTIANVLVRRVTAVNRAVSKRFCRGRDSRAITRCTAAARALRKTLWRVARTTRQPSRPSSATNSVLPARWQV